MLSIHGVERAAERLGDEQLAQRVARLPRQLEALAQLVERLLDVSRIRAGRVGIGTREMDLAVLVLEAVERFRAAAAQVGSTIDAQVPPDEVIGVWDRPRLEEVLNSLLGNAVKFAPGAPIEVRVTADDENVYLTVRDYGIGIAPEKLPFIFDRFERGVSARSYGGLGLGLYLARQIVEAHGGEIEAHNEPDRGARFTVRLPRHASRILNDRR